MAQALSPQFRPGIVIFVGEGNKNVRNYMRTLLQNLETPLRHCIGLIDYVSDTSASQLVIEDGPPHRSRTPPLVNGDFQSVFRDTLKQVQGELNRQTIVDTLGLGYNLETQIYIVGQAHSEASQLSQVLKALYQQLRDDVIHAQIYYVLNEYNRRGINRISGVTAPSSLASFDLVNFCYLYEEINMRPTVTGEKASNYSVAETLFSLLATGVTEFPGLREAFSLREGLAQYDGHIGGMSTSMVMFPRSHAERYCADLLGSALLRYWRTANSGVLSDNERREQERRAQGVAKSIHAWMRESEPRPGTPSEADTKEYRWPNLSILRDRDAVAGNAVGAARGVVATVVGAGGVEAQPDPQAHIRYSMGRRLKEQTERLFTPLSFEAVTEDYRRQLQGNRRLKRRKAEPESWVKIVERRAVRSEDAFQQWNSQARVAWIGAREKVLEQVRATFNELSTTNKNGIELASIYVEELHERLKDVAEELVRWRVRHDEEYASALSEFDELADGDWVDTSSLGAANGAGTIALHPVAGQAPIAPTNGGFSAAGPVIVGASGGGPPPIPEFHHMPEREERIARRLGQRVGWHEAQIPALTNIASATLMVAPTLAALGMGFAPSLNTSPLLGIYMASGIAGIGILSGYGYRLNQQNAVIKAKQDLINFYRSYYVHRCESREDVLRSLALSPLMRLVAELLEQLHDMQARLMHVEGVLRQDAEDTVQELFESPAMERDIFVANGERLYREDVDNEGQPQYTLEQFAARVEQERLERPVEEFHRTDEDMTAHMLHWLDREGIHILNAHDLTDEEAAVRVREFALGIIQQYLNGSLVDIGKTLSDPEVWKYVLDRVEVPLYRFYAGRVDAEFQFVAGSDRHLALSQRLIPTEAHVVRTLNTEWLLVSSFFRGKPLFDINPASLFLANSNQDREVSKFIELPLVDGDEKSPLSDHEELPPIGDDGKEGDPNRGGDGSLEKDGDGESKPVDDKELPFVDGESKPVGYGESPPIGYDESPFVDGKSEPFDDKELPLVDGQPDADAQKEREYQLPQLQGPPSATSYMLPPSEEEESSPNERSYRAPHLQQRTLNDERGIQVPYLRNNAARTEADYQQSVDKDQAAQQPSVEQSSAAGSQVQPTQPGTLDDGAAKRARHQAEDDAQGLFKQIFGFMPERQQPNEPPNS